MTPTSRPLRVVLVVSNLEFGGTQRQVLHLARALDRRRFETHVCSLSRYLPLAAATGSAPAVQVVAKASKYDLSVVFRLRRLLLERQADLVHGFLFDAQLAARLAGRLARVPLVIDSERNSDYDLRPVQRLAFRLTRGCVDLVVANSRAGAAFHRRIHGHAEGQYRVVYNGVDTERFRPMPREQVRQQLGFTPGDRVAGIFASFKPQKNHVLFFKAAARVLRDQPALRLLVVGDELAGGLRNSHDHKLRVSRLVDELGLRDRCLFVGNRQDPERLYNACDVVVLPSLHEGTPNVLLEALACGIPALATDVGDNAHVLAHENGGLVVPSGDEVRLADALARLLGDAALRARLSSRGRRRILENFSLESLGAEMGRVYEAGWLARTSPAVLATGALPAPR